MASIQARPSMNWVDDEVWTPVGGIGQSLPLQDSASVVAQEQMATVDPRVIGYGAFGATIFTICSAYAGWFGMSATDIVTVVPVALIFGGITMFLTGMWSFRRGDILTTTVFTSFSAYFAAWSIYQWLAFAHVLPGGGSNTGSAHVFGIWTLMFALIAVYTALAAVPHNLPLTIMLLAFAWALVFNAINSFVGGRGILLGFSAYGALVSAVFAFYLSAAVILNSTAQRQILPIHPAMGARTRPPAMRRPLRTADRAMPDAG
jgi:succinate-acetate transporter protein